MEQEHDEPQRVHQHIPELEGSAKLRDSREHDPDQHPDAPEGQEASGRPERDVAAVTVTREIVPHQHSTQRSEQDHDRGSGRNSLVRLRRLAVRKSHVRSRPRYRLGLAPFTGCRLPFIFGTHPDHREAVPVLNFSDGSAFEQFVERRPHVHAVTTCNRHRDLLVRNTSVALATKFPLRAT